MPRRVRTSVGALAAAAATAALTAATAGPAAATMPGGAFAGVSPVGLAAAAVAASPPSCNQQPALNVRPGATVHLFFGCFGQSGSVTSVNVTEQPTKGTLTHDQFGGPTAFTYAVNSGASGADHFTITASDANGTSAPMTTQVTISPDANNVPQCFTSSRTTRHDRAVAISMPCSDADGDPLTYDITGPSHGTLTPGTSRGVYTYTPNAGYIGDDAISVQASDDHGGTSTPRATMSISVVSDAADQAPACFAATAFHLARNHARTFFPPCSDPEGDALTYSVVAPPQHLTVGTPPAGPGLLLTPENGFTGTTSLTITASDGVKDSAAQTYDIVVDPPAAPTCSAPTPDPRGVRTNRARTLVLPCSDPQFDALDIVIDTQPAHGTLSRIGGVSYSYTPDRDYTGADEFTFHATNANGTTASRTWHLNVADDANDAPTCFGTTVSVRAGSQRTIPLTCFDGDGDPLTYHADTQPAHGTLGAPSTSGSTTSVPYTPSAGYLGSDSFTGHATDDHGGSSPVVTIMLNVVSATTNGNPTCAAFPLPVTGFAVEATPPCSDPDGDTLTFEKLSDPSHGTLMVPGAAGAYRYTPDPGYSGPDSFTYRMTDGHGGSTGTQTQSFNVTASSPSTNHAPLCSDGSAAVPARTSDADGGSYTGTPPCEDADGDPLTYITESGPAHGRLEPLGDGRIRYIPDVGFQGDDPVRYHAVDSKGAGSATRTFTFHVSGSSNNGGSGTDGGGSNGGGDATNGGGSNGGDTSTTTGDTTTTGGSSSAAGAGSAGAVAASGGGGSATGGGSTTGAKTPLQLAASLLGGSAKAMNLGLGSAIQAFVPSAPAPATSGSPFAVLYTDGTGVVTVAPQLLLDGAKATASAARAKAVRLATQKVTLKAGVPVALKLKLGAAQRKLIAKAHKASLAVTFTSKVKGKVTTSRRTFPLKIKK